MSLPGSRRPVGIFAGGVNLGLTDNPFFPNLPVSLADLSAAMDGYWTAYVNSMGGGKILTALKRCGTQQTGFGFTG